MDSSLNGQSQSIYTQPVYTQPIYTQPVYRVPAYAKDPYFGAAALVLGILAVLTFGFFINILFALLSIVFACIHFSRKRICGNGMAIAGIIASIASIIMLALLLWSIRSGILASSSLNDTSLYDFYINYLLYGFFH